MLSIACLIRQNKKNIVSCCNTANDMLDAKNQLNVSIHILGSQITFAIN